MINGTVACETYHICRNFFMQTIYLKIFFKLLKHLIAVNGPVVLSEARLLYFPCASLCITTLCLKKHF